MVKLKVSVEKATHLAQIWMFTKCAYPSENQFPYPPSLRQSMGNVESPLSFLLKKKDLTPTNFNEAFHINANTCGFFGKKNIPYVI